MTLCSQREIEHRIRGIVLSLSIRYGRAVAERFLAKFNRDMRRVQRFTLSGSRVPENPDWEMRQIIVWKNYRVLYFVEAARGAIWVLNIRSTAQVATVPELPEGLRISNRQQDDAKSYCLAVAARCRAPSALAACPPGWSFASPCL